MPLAFLSSRIGLLLAACASLPTWAQTSVPPIPPVRQVESLGLVQQNRHVTCRDGTYSAVINRRVIWTFNDTCMDKGGVLGDTFIDNTLSWDPHVDASQGIRLEGDLKDAQGVPVRFMPFTQWELDYTASHAPNEIAVWPGHIVPDPARQRVLIFYGSVYRGSQIGFNTTGSGIAVADMAMRRVTRPPQNPDPSAFEPAYMWSRQEIAYTGGYVLEGDMLYSYGGKGEFLSTLMHVARVPLADALNKAAWRYYAGDGVWSEDPGQARSIYTGGAAGDNIFYSSDLGMYVTIYQPFLDNTVYYRVAYRPEGPWSAQTALFTAEQGTDPSYAARVHTGYQEQGGRVQYITYVKNTGLFRQELPLTRVTFGKP